MCISSHLWPLVPSKWIETEHLVLELLMFTTVTKNKVDEGSDCGGNKEINSCDLSLRPVSVCSWWLFFADILLVPSLKVYFLTKVQACTSSSSSLMYLLPLTPLLNACPLIPCSIGHEDFSMLFFFQSRLPQVPFPKAFPPTSRCSLLKRYSFPSTLSPLSLGDLSCWCVCNYYLYPTTFKILIYCWSSTHRFHMSLPP